MILPQELLLQHDTSVISLGRNMRRDSEEETPDQAVAFSAVNVDNDVIESGGDTGSGKYQFDQTAVDSFLQQKSEELKLPTVRPLKPEKFAKRLSKEDIRLVYAFERVLGTGNFGTARVAHKIANPNAKFAIKSIPRSKIESDMDLFEQELGILLSVDHPNIVKFYEAFLDHKYVHLVMELCHGGELFERLQAKRIFTEDEARVIIK